MHKTDIAQAPCLVCGQGNTPNNDGSRKEFIDLERDVNWNDPALICDTCAVKIGVLAGCVSADQAKDQARELKKKDEEIHTLKTELDEANRARRNAVKRARARETLSA